MKIRRIMMFPNGNTAVFDYQDNQMVELQKGWLETWLDFISSKGFNPEGLEILMPDSRHATVFKIPDGWNWRIK